jgi:HK97 family phage major capsid protein
MSDIVELKEKVTELVTKTQKRLDSLEEKGKSTDEGVEAMKSEFVELSEKIQAQADAIRAEEDERKALENLMARMPENGKTDELHSDPEYRSAFVKYMRSRQGIDEETERKNAEQLLEFHGLNTDEKAVDNLIIKAGLVGSNPDGGFLAPIDPVRFISGRIFETSPVRQVANVISTAREAVSIIIDDTEPTSGWVAEVDSRPETDTPKVAELEIPTHEQYAEPRISTKALDDVSINLEAWLQDKVAMKFARAENEAFMTGNGIKKPRGILDYESWTTQGEYERWKLEHRDTATVGTIAADDFIDVQSDLLEEYQANALWMMHRKVWAEVMQLKDSDNQYLLNPMLLFSGVDMQLLGRPVRFAGDMDSTIAEGNSIAIYGNFREGYTVVDRIGIRVLRDPYTDKRYVKFYTTKRVGGAVTNYQALKVLDVQAS